MGVRVFDTLTLHHLTVFVLHRQEKHVWFIIFFYSEKRQNDVYCVFKNYYREEFSKIDIRPLGFVWFIFFKTISNYLKKSRTGRTRLVPFFLL